MNQEQLHQIQATSKVDYTIQIRQIIQNVSQSGKYQIKLTVFFMLISLFTNIEFNSSHLFYMNPSFYCDGNMEVKVKEADACNRLQSCTLVKSDTLTAELHMYCDSKKDDRVFIQSAASLGNIGGVVFSFLISDRKGRKFSIILSLILINLGYLAQYIGINQNVTTLLWMAQIIYGFCGKVIYVNFIIICTRFLRKSLYETTSIGWYIMAAAPTLIVGVINLIFPNWRWLFGLYASGMFILAVASFFILHEDPIYYFDSGKYQDFKEVIQDISKRNCTSSVILEKNQQEMNQLILAKTKDLKRQQLDDDYNYLNLLDCRIIQASFILGLAGMFFTMTSGSIDFALPGLKLQYDYNLMIGGASNIVGYLTSILLIRSDMKRKTGFLLASAICGSAGMFFGFKFCLQNTIIQTILITILRISLCWIGAFWVRLKVDLFPEKYQAAIIAFIELWTNLGKTFAPYVTDFSNQKGLSAIFTVNLMHITIGTLPVLFLIEKKIQISKQEQSPNEKAKL